MPWFVPIKVCAVVEIDMPVDWGVTLPKLRAFARRYGRGTRQRQEFFFRCTEQQIAEGEKLVGYIPSKDFPPERKATLAVGAVEIFFFGRV